ncbi:MAG TPA: hypothetical protein VFV50_08130, partial [Bdellovibrionales bacterium]|nr:hypothetical protein [Bdellovibrionales bacterium]
RWASDNSGIPLELDLVAILKGVYACGADDQCADIEISGQVGIPQKIPKLRLDSEITGRMLFAVRHGSIIWSEIRTNERLVADSHESNVSSCMKSRIEEPSAYTWTWDSGVKCEPGESFANMLPGTKASEN